MNEKIVFLFSISVYIRMILLNPEKRFFFGLKKNLFKLYFCNKFSPNILTNTKKKNHLP